MQVMVCRLIVSHCSSKVTTEKKYLIIIVACLAHGMSLLFPRKLFSSRYSGRRPNCITVGCMTNWFRR